MRIFIISRGYPAPEHLYNYPFVHRRALAYQALGHQVFVYALSKPGQAQKRTYDGITLLEGDPRYIPEHVDLFQPDCIAAHGFTDDFWPALKSLPKTLPIFGWTHGSEIIPVYKYSQHFAPPETTAEKHFIFERRKDFWSSLLADWPPNLHIVFVSEHAAEKSFSTLGQNLPVSTWSILNNPIDTRLFAYDEKPEEQRYNILSIRSYNDWVYATDLITETILKLAEHSLFSKFSFSLTGKGKMFDKMTAPLAKFKNVQRQKTFLTQMEIATAHKKHGIFLVPSRFDTQGVSRDEAMSSGLVPVTNKVGAIPDLLTPKEAGLADPENADQLAQQILDMASSPDLFMKRSKNAARSIRNMRSNNIIIPQELSLLSKEPPFV